MAAIKTTISLLTLLLLIKEYIYFHHKPPHPHIVFILADDLGYNDIGYHAIHGMSAVRTPHLDALAADGVKLENYYVHPICSPSRSAFMTGRYPIRYGLQHKYIEAPQPTCLPLSETTLPEKLKESGYSTHAIGKWDLGICMTRCLPTRRGFDSFFGYGIAGSDFYTYNKTYDFHSDAEEQLVNDINHFDIDLEDDYDGEEEDINGDMWNGRDFWQNESVNWGYDEVYSTTLLTIKAQETIEKHDTKEPMFLYLAYKSVHFPLQAPQHYVDMFQHIEDMDRRVYAAMTYIMDEGVRNITETLKENGMWDDTVLVFSTDNGGYPKYSGNNWPLKGEKSDLWEGGVRAVGFVNSPLLSDDVRGTVNNELMHISDWLPTLVEGVAEGNTEQMTKPLDGVNQWKTISEGGQSNRMEILLNIDELERFPTMQPEEQIYWLENLGGHETFNPLIRAAIRNGDWKLLTGYQNPFATWVPPPESGVREQTLLNSSPYCTQEESVINLFNIKYDPHETCNLARNLKYLPIVAELLKQLRNYSDEAVPAYYPANDPRANPILRGGAWTPWLDHDLETLLKLYPYKPKNILGRT